MSDDEAIMTRAYWLLHELNRFVGPARYEAERPRLRAIEDALHRRLVDRFPGRGPMRPAAA